MFVFAKPLETRRFKAVAGMPLPAKLNTVYGRRYLKTTYGDDVIAEVDYEHPETFIQLLDAKTDKGIREAYGKLKMVCDEQAKQLASYKSEVAQLQKKLRLSGQTNPE